ncbi:MAG: GxxExxY protein [Longimicrobiales bacterium]
MLDVVSSRYRLQARRSATFGIGISRRGRGGRRGSGVRSVNPVTEAIIGDAISVHRELGPGMLENIYEECLAMLLQQRGLKVELNTYLKFSNCEVGLLINFNVTRLVDGLRRVVRGYDDASQASPSSAPSARNPVPGVAATRRQS